MTRYCRIESEGRARWGEIVGDEIRLLGGEPWIHTTLSGQAVPLDGVKYLPVSDASKVVCIGQNYRKHAVEMGKQIPAEPLLFIKPSTALNAHGAAIRLPPESREVHHEAELGLVIGRRLSRVSAAEARAGIFGLTCFNDVTARDIQKRETQHTRAKSYDTFACCGPHLVTGVDWSHLRIQLRVNGVTRQDGNTDDMVFAPDVLVAFISSVMTLLPGDIVSTGTPSGVGPLVAGEVVEVEIDQVGILRNAVAA